MAYTVSDFLLDRLSVWRIRGIYGYPGDGINGILGALGRAGDRFQFTQTHHEEMAAFMACAHAKFTGYEMMMECDTLLMVGSNFPYSEFLPKEGQAQGVQIDLDARVLSIRYPMEVNLVGDSAEILRALIPLLHRKADRSRRDTIERNVAEWWRVLESRALQTANPVNPQRVFCELSPRLPDNCIISANSGSGTNWYARDVKIRRGMIASLSGGLATMGPGVPYAIAAKFAYPERPVIALVGDGAMRMNGNAELVMVEKYWQEWRDPRFIVMVLNNRDLDQVTWEQRALAGDPKYEASQDLPDFPYARYAESRGFLGIEVNQPEAIGPTWERALSADRPVLLEVHSDPNVPPLPPHISFEQARAYLSALFGGDVDACGILKASAKAIAVSVAPEPDKA